MKRPCIAIEGFLASSTRPTGVEHFAADVLRAIHQLSDVKAQIVLYVAAGFPAYEAPSHVVVRRRPDVNTLLYGPWMRSWLWRDRPDVYYTFGHRLAWPVPGKRALTLYDTAFDAFPECYPAGDAERAHAEVAAACGAADLLVTPSRATADCLVRDYGADPSRLWPIGAAARPIFRAGEAPPLPRAVSEAGVAAPFFLCVGRLDRRKNLERAIEAYRRLLGSGEACGGLVLVGPDDSGSTAVREAMGRSPHPGERIAVTGYLADDELAGLYRAAAALVYPSLAEGFGLPVLEAMASGTPVITSNCSSMPEVAGDAALLVDPGSTEELAAAMERILCHPETAATLRERGLHRAGEFSWERTARRLVEGLELLAQDRLGASRHE